MQREVSDTVCPRAQDHNRCVTVATLNALQAAMSYKQCRAEGGGPYQISSTASSSHLHSMHRTQRRPVPVAALRSCNRVRIRMVRLQLLHRLKVSCRVPTAS